jgi:uncharacterized protein YpiB (UPF0302 family)
MSESIADKLTNAAMKCGYCFAPSCEKARKEFKSLATLIGERIESVEQCSLQTISREILWHQLDEAYQNNEKDKIQELRKLLRVTEE